MKRRYANHIEGIYSQKRVNEDFFKGYVCNVKIKDVIKPIIVDNGVTKICIKDNDYEWFEVYPDNDNYAITIMFDNKLNLIEWYFDIAKEIGIDNDIPYEEDLYLDMIMMPDGQKIILDEDELIEAYNKGEISKTDVSLAYDTLKKLEIKYENNIEELMILTNKISELFKSKAKIKSLNKK